jgi:hypothetical protein
MLAAPLQKQVDADLLLLGDFADGFAKGERPHYLFFKFGGVALLSFMAHWGGQCLVGLSLV